MPHHLLGTAEIALILGVSRQRVAQLIESYEDFPEPEAELGAGRVWSRTAIETWIASHPEREPGRPERADKPRRAWFFGRKSSGMFERFTDRARNSVVKAQEEARLLNHKYIGTEHLLLGLLGIGEGIARQVLTGLGVTTETTRDHVRRMIGTGDETPEGHIPFTPRSQNVLEIALREARELGHNYVGTEHILLAIAREGEGVGWQVLALHGVKVRSLRKSILDALQGVLATRSSARTGSVFTKPALVPKGQFVLCSFCGKPCTETKACIAGTGGYICDECVRVCMRILGEKEEPESELGKRVSELEDRIARLEGGS